MCCRITPEISGAHAADMPSTCSSTDQTHTMLSTAQVWRVLQDNPEISEDRMLSEIGMLFVEGFETTGE